MTKDVQPESPTGFEEQKEFYNKVFKSLVDDAQPSEGQLIGTLAYGLYKIGKREWLLDYRREHGQPPGPEAHREYIRSLTPMVLDAYRSRAAEVLADYAGSVLEAERPRIVEEALRGGFWRGFWPSFVASIAFSLVLAAIVFIAAISGFGLPIQFAAPIVASP